MKNVIFAALALTALGACQPPDAPTDAPSVALSGGKKAKLHCTAGDFKAFDATLDSSSFDPGSGYFDVRDARIMDNYATARLTCTGHELADIDCIGFWFDIGSEIVEVTTSDANGLAATYHSLKGHLVANLAKPWACTVN